MNKTVITSRFILPGLLLALGTVQAFAQPTANFTANTVCRGSETVFTNTSTPNGSSIVLYAWDFGDGDGAPVRDPHHTFATSGTKNVTLTVVDENGHEGSITKAVTVHPSPAVGFSLSGTNRCVSVAQSFQNLSTISAGSMTYSWDFGDGDNSTAPNPSHSYATYGTYEVILTATSNNTCVEEATQNITILPEPQADFTHQATACLGESLSFTNNSAIAEGNLTYQWDFGDLSAGSTEINPTHTYAGTGTFSVTLVVNSVDGSCEDQVTKQVNVYAEPSAGFTFSDECLGDAVSFSNTSSIASGSMTYLWSFGDGAESTGTSPSHTYDNPGSYEVTLTSTSNNNCVDEATQVVNVQPLPSAAFTVEDVCLGDEAVFSNLSEVATGGLAYTWSFGDGNNSGTANPSHTYASAGLFNVQLEAESDFGCVDIYNGSIRVYAASQGGSVSGSTTRCEDDNGTYTLTLSGHTGDVVRWERSLTGTDQWTTMDHVSTTLDYSDLQETTWFRAIVKSGVCEEEASASAMIGIDALGVGGTVSGGTEVCSGTNSTTLTLSGQLGTIIDWEQSTTGGAPWTSVGVTTTSLTVDDLTATTYYRVEIQNGVCDPVYSEVAEISVVPETDGGSVSGSTTRCEDDNGTYTLTLSGHTGDVVRWERSLTGTDQWTTIDHVSTTLDYSDLQETTWFRAIVKSGVCEEEASASAMIGIDALGVGGTVSGGTEVCSGTNSTTLTLSGQLGTIIDWEQSTTGGAPWTSVGVTTTSLTVDDLTATTYYRVEIQNGVCDPVYSEVAEISVVPETEGGSVSGSTTRCEDDNGTYTLTLSGHTGDVVRWERSLTGTDQWTTMDHVSTTLDYSDLQETTWFRAIVKSGVCEEEASASAMIGIDALGVGGTVSGGTEVCSGTNSTTLTLSGQMGTIIDWEQSTTGGAPWTSVGVNTTSLPVDDLTATTYYRVEIQNGVCDPVYSEVAEISVVPETDGGSVSGSTTRCEDDNGTYTLTLSGHTGDVVRWERSLTGTDQWTTIDHVSTTLDYSDLQETTWFRAIVKSGVCEEEASASAMIGIDALGVGGTVSGGTEVCSGTNSTTLTLSGQLGTIIDWEQSTTGGAPWTSVGVTTTSLPVDDLTATTYYRVEIQNGVCDPVYSEVAEISVVPETDGGSVSGSTTRCEDDNGTYTLTLSGHTGDVVRWERSLTGTDQWTTIDHVSTTLDYSDLQETTWFRAIVKSGVCEEEASASAMIGIDALGVGGTVSGGTEVCSGTNSTTLTLSGQLGTIIDWEQSTTGGAPWTSVGVTTTSLPVDDLTATTYYRVEIQNGVCDPVYSEVAEISVVPETDGGILSGQVTVCKGDNSGQVTLNDHTGEVLRWEYSLTGQQPWAPIEATTSTLDYTNLEVSTWYRAVVQSGVCASEISNMVKVQVDQPTILGSISGPGEVCTDLNSGSLTLSGYLGDIVKWQRSEDQTNWIDITNITASQAFQNLTATTFYRAEVQNGVCSVGFSEAYEVEVFDLPAVSFSTEEVCQGANTTFTNTTTVADGNLRSFQWDFADGGSSLLKAPAHTYSTAGSYLVKLIVESSKGCIDSLSQNVVVNPNPQASFSQSDICIGTAMDFSDLSSVGLGSIASYSWDFGDGAGSSSGDVSHTYATDGSFEVDLMITTDKGCVGNTSEIVNVYPRPVTSFATEGVCHGGKTSFLNNSSISSGTLTYEWDFGDTNQSTAVNPSHTYATDGDYIAFLRSTSAFGCTSGQSVTVKVYEQPEALFSFDDVCLDAPVAFVDGSTGAGLTYSWEFGDGGASDEQSPVHQYESAGFYPVSLSVVSPEGCSSTKSQVVKVSALPVVHFTMPDVCLEQEVAFTNLSTISSGTLVYTWDFGDGNTSALSSPAHLYAQDGTYDVTLTASSGFGCEVTSTREVDVHPLPVPAFSAEAVCDGSLTLFVDESTINTGRIEEYLWDFGDQTNSILSNPQKQYLNPGIYTASLLVKSDFGCKAETMREVMIHDFPVANFTVENVCYGFSITPENTSQVSSGNLTYLWDFGDGRTSTSMSPVHLYDQPGLYEITLSATSANNCTDVITRPVVIYEVPEVSAGEDTVVSQGYSVRLSAQGGVEYSWYPLEGLDNSNVRSPIASPLATTDYEVTVVDQYGCRNADTVRVTVEEDFKIVANNVFTPDDNGQNDTWIIQNVETFGNVNVRVYDRYGSLIFQEEAYQNDWTGTYGNDILPDGTYFYVITFSESDLKYQGALTIIRNR